jgi:hypothetical protein
MIHSAQQIRMQKLKRGIKQHRIALTMLVFVFIGWVYLADRNSYWLDEIYSVLVHALQCDSAAEVIRSMWGIIHPPVYQLALFQWIKIFGHTEVATRSLSALFIVLAGLFLYLFACRLSGRRLAWIVLVLFCLMYIPVYYALETRSYAMMILWASASSWSLYPFLMDISSQRFGRRFWLSAPGIRLACINTAGLFTHYYFVFFLAAQGAFLLLVFLIKHKGWRQPAPLIRLGVVLTLPLLMLLVLWGRSMQQRYAKGGRFEVDTPTYSLPEAFLRYVIDPNVSLGQPIVAICLVFGIVLALRCVVRLSAARTCDLRAWLNLYALIWLVVPTGIAFVVLALAKQDAYKARYFVFSAPALALIIGLGAIETMRWIDFLIRNTTRIHILRGVYVMFFPLSLGLAAVTVLPGGYNAATQSKDDWRGQAIMIHNIVTHDPDHSYLVFHTAHRRKLMSLDYYFQRIGSHVRTTLNLTPSHDRALQRGGSFILDDSKNQHLISKHDFMIVAFNHLRARRMKNTVDWFDHHYELHYKVMDHTGRGIRVYKTSPP